VLNTSKNAAKTIDSKSGKSYTENYRNSMGDSLL
tara:strand:+ start:3468 stop:3569 length:102 start_codon:yes stop_codon:yes gene_type:complete